MKYGVQLFEDPEEQMLIWYVQNLGVAKHSNIRPCCGRILKVCTVSSRSCSASDQSLGHLDVFFLISGTVHLKSSN